MKAMLWHRARRREEKWRDAARLTMFTAVLQALPSTNVTRALCHASMVQLQPVMVAQTEMRRPQTRASSCERARPAQQPARPRPSVTPLFVLVRGWCCRHRHASTAATEGEARRRRHAVARACFVVGRL